MITFYVAFAAELETWTEVAPVTPGHNRTQRDTIHARQFVDAPYYLAIEVDDVIGSFSV